MPQPGVEVNIQVIKWRHILCYFSAFPFVFMMIVDVHNWFEATHCQSAVVHLNNRRQNNDLKNLQKQSTEIICFINLLDQNIHIYTHAKIIGLTNNIKILQFHFNREYDQQVCMYVCIVY